MGKGFSTRETLLLLKAGYDIDAIANAKEIKPQTVYGHIAELINQDQLTDFSGIITRQQYLRVMEVAKEHPGELYEILGSEMPSGLPKVALAISDFLLRHKSN
ncbi:MAG: helix-turn-helix domain-containing protein [Muribaculaceae bacterium]|nr:helix-turn-helix domain-containing protein [Muribaculaceae bacterium]